MIIQIKYELLLELLEAGGQAAQVQLLAPTHQLQHLSPQLLVHSNNFGSICKSEQFSDVLLT